MDANERNQLVGLMARLAAGDLAACTELYLSFGHRIRASLVAIGRIHGVQLGRDDARALTIDACTGVFPDVARSWRPEGALPWTWARQRLARLIDDNFGHQHAHDRLPPDEDLERAATDESWMGADPDPEVTFAGLATRNPTVGLLHSACLDVLTDGERSTLLRYELQRCGGDPSPANTVGSELALAPAAVRQRVSRAKRKLATLAASDERYQPLAGLELLATSRSQAA